ncbi:hypothetical protein F0562_013868 [Nyssa sinensis]|uniref:GDSL esterase/lipase n=1 Tax=Nyssa sinensis TaxID=561372 RepID=A0A5J4ZRA2_9ASTE|nr:hypothetical protein F0562_013868 [Nyssa sinensis]
MESPPSGVGLTPNRRRCYVWMGAYAIGCYTSIFGFGDSLLDTGNALHFYPPDDPPNFGRLPYGETFFHHPTGRCCDGRLIVDFIAQALGLPFLPPYFGGWNSSEAADFEKGVNFAVVGSQALDDSFFEERGMNVTYQNTSMRCQLSWFKDFLPSLCLPSSDCQKVLKSSLFILDFGGNDYGHALLAGRSVQEVQSYVPLVVNAIASTINELIELGARTIMVAGGIPLGCLALFLTEFISSNKEDYDPMTGCLTWFNNLVEYHNEQLQIELNRIRELQPYATIIYADYYNIAMPFYISPRKFGFTKGALVACCGDGGPYNVNTSVLCGNPPSTAADNPFLYVGWDGLHLTEAAYKLISKALLEGPYTIPHINTSCVSIAGSSEYLNYDPSLSLSSPTGLYPSRGLTSSTVLETPFSHSLPLENSGFTKRTLTACCRAGELPYHFHSSTPLMDSRVAIVEKLSVCRLRGLRQIKEDVFLVVKIMDMVSMGSLCGTICQCVIGPTE